jgi:hypothetical protein
MQHSLISYQDIHTHTHTFIHQDTPTTICHKRPPQGRSMQHSLGSYQAIHTYTHTHTHIFIHQTTPTSTCHKGPPQGRSMQHSLGSYQAIPSFLDMKTRITWSYRHCVCLRAWCLQPCFATGLLWVRMCGGKNDVLWHVCVCLTGCVCLCMRFRAWCLQPCFATGLLCRRMYGGKNDMLWVALCVLDRPYVCACVQSSCCVRVCTDVRMTCCGWPLSVLACVVPAAMFCYWTALHMYVRR